MCWEKGIVVVESRRCNLASVGRGQKVIGSLELWGPGITWVGVSKVWDLYGVGCLESNLMSDFICLSIFKFPNGITSGIS